MKVVQDIRDLLLHVPQAAAFHQEDHPHLMAEVIQVEAAAIREAVLQVAAPLHTDLQVAAAVHLPEEEDRFYRNINLSWCSFLSWSGGILL